MLAIIAIIASAVAMSRIAGMSDMNSTKWGIITFGICFGLSFIVPFPFGGVVIGFPLSYGIMVYTTMKK